MVVPLMSRANLLGAITFVSADGGHTFSDTDLELAEDMAALCAVAVADAHLVREAEDARARTVQLNERLVAAFRKELAPYPMSRGTIRFPLSEPVPTKLIAGIAKFLFQEASERADAKAAKTKLKGKAKTKAATPKTKQKAASRR